MLKLKKMNIYIKKTIKHRRRRRKKIKNRKKIE